MRALVQIEVDQLGGFADAANRRLLNRFALPRDGDHAAIVVGVHLAIEQIDAGNLHRFDNRLDLGRIAAFGKVGNAFNERGSHAKSIRFVSRSRNPAGDRERADAGRR